MHELLAALESMIDHGPKPQFDPRDPAVRAMMDELDTVLMPLDPLPAPIAEFMKSHPDPTLSECEVIEQWVDKTYRLRPEYKAVAEIVYKSVMIISERDPTPGQCRMKRKEREAMGWFPPYNALDRHLMTISAERISKALRRPE